MRVFEDERLVRYIVAEKSTACAFSVLEGKGTTLENVAEEAVACHLLSWFTDSWDTKILGDDWCNENKQSKMKGIVGHRDLW